MKRIQRQRTKGWRMPEGAIYVGRSSRWGNPWRVGDVWDAPFVWHVDLAARAVVNGLVKITPPIAVALYDASLMRDTNRGFHYLDVPGQEARYVPLAPLRGHDLACWCPLCPAHADGLPLGVVCADCSPCHADLLLSLANP